MDFKAKLIEKGLELIQDERVSKLMSDERVIKAVMQAVEMRGRVQENFEERVQQIAKSLNLATQQEVKDLKRTIRKMERELERSKNAASSPVPPTQVN